jgi:uncharacterized protein
MRKRAPLIFFALLLASALVSVPASAAERIRLGGGPSGGGLFPLTTAVYKIIKLHLPEFQVSPPQVTGGSVENTRLLGTNKVNFAYTSEVADAASGIGKWKNESYTNIRTVYMIPYGSQQVVTLDSTRIKSFKDMKGKRICLGPAGSGGANRAEKLILPAHDLNKGDYSASWQPYSGACNGLRDGTIDVAFISMRAPTPAVMELAAFKKVFLVPMDVDAISKITKKYPKLSKGYNAPDSYGENQTNTEPALTLDLILALATNVETPEDVVYKVTKANWEYIEEYHKASHTATFVTLDRAFDAMPAPLHPGAEKYYREIGVWPPKQ